MTSFQTLSANLAALPVKDQAFAQSLLDQAAKKGLSDKQMFWVEKLAARATGSEPAAAAPAQVGNFAGVIALFQAAKAHKAFPKISLLLDDGRKIVLTLAGEKAKMPGTVNVTDGGKFGSNVWYGRVDPTGAWQVSGKVDHATQVKLAGLLALLANDPAGTAAEYGVTTHHCCFCQKELTHPDSKAVGYGPDCADHFGLPWGAKTTKALTCEGVA
jgi:hypothetical protein